MTIESEFKRPAGSRTLLTFDCYGTLIDWEAGILGALRAAYSAANEIGDDALLSQFHEAQNALKTDSYRPYRQLLTQVAQRLATERGWDVGEATASVVPTSVPTWRPFPDTNAALQRLSDADVTLGILSNIDNDLLAGTLEHFGVRFDLIGTAQNLQSYKPAERHFQRGREWAAEHDQWMHVAQSLFHDIVPTTTLGIPAVWVNRNGEDLPADAAPAFVAPDLAGAADWLLGD